MAEEQSIHLSQDGSHTLFSQKYNAHYHSTFGAIEESLHVFIAAGLYQQYLNGKKHLKIFEMGFGTGLNALLSLLEATKYNISVEYCTVESDPIQANFISLINYCDHLNCNSDLFHQMHDSKWNISLKLNENFIFQKNLCKIEDFLFDYQYDLIYWDAFAPSCQAHLWEKPIHQKVFNSLSPTGVLVSYCSMGKFRRMLEDLGYIVEKLKGPGKKREMIRATKSFWL